MAYSIQRAANIITGNVIQPPDLLDNFNGIIAEFTNLKAGTLNSQVYNSGSVLTTGTGMSYFISPYQLIISGWTIYSPVSGSIVFDIERATSGAPTTFTSLIGAGTPPTLTSANQATSNITTGWTTSINPGDIIRIDVTSVSTSTLAILSIPVLRVT